MQSRPWSKEVENSQIIYEWKKPEAKITFFLSSQSLQNEGCGYLRVGSNNETSINIEFNKKIASDQHQIASINNIFAELSQKNISLPDAWGVCLDFFCHMQVQFRDFSCLPNFINMFNQENYDEALKILTTLQDHGYHNEIWEFCQALDNGSGPGKSKNDYICGSFNNDKLIQWYEAINENNPFYPHANLRLFFLYSRKIGGAKLEEQDKKKLLEYALKSGDEMMIYFVSCSIDDKAKIAQFIASLSQKYYALTTNGHANMFQPPKQWPGLPQLEINKIRNETTIRPKL